MKPWPARPRWGRLGPALLPAPSREETILQQATFSDPVYLSRAGAPTRRSHGGLGRWEEALLEESFTEFDQESAVHVENGDRGAADRGAADQEYALPPEVPRLLLAARVE